MKQQQNTNQQSQNTGKVVNGIFNPFKQLEKDVFNSQLSKNLIGAKEKNECGEKVIINETAPHLKDELTIGKSHSWNESTPNDANAEQTELDKNVKKKPFVTEIESKETKERRIKQASVGEAF